MCLPLIGHLTFIVLQELNEEHTRILTARNPQAAENIVRFSHKVNRTDVRES